MKRGFTLIELLVVVAIIGMLSSVVLASLNAARGNARDARRLQDVQQIRTALELYHSANGQYPAYSGAYCVGGSGGCWNETVPTHAGFNASLQPFMSSLPADPSGDRGFGDRYVYVNGSVAKWCGAPGGGNVVGKFLVWMPDTPTPTSDAQCGAGFYACCGSVGCAANRYCVLQLE